MAAARPRDLQPSSNAESPAAVSTVKLEAALKKVSAQAAQYEHQMKDVESQLAESLSNFRAIDSLLQKRFLVSGNAQRADHALGKQLDSSMVSLKRLADELPTIQAQAQSLLTDLTWLNTEFYERWRMIIFTSSSPVSWRWKVLMRLVFAISFVMFTWLTWITAWGRLPGSSLMS
ncbi:hypothetical protein R3P38DRAFT_3016415 [Favolaschia claudopus]|uniref:Uncharacterized protein n=1 Tax=Favolaschia claudopus TaxID=2862362 RepID=A0AAW0AJJ5_9AGAR